MKDNTRVTLMVCTAANGEKNTIAIVGKSKNPDFLKVALSYTH